MFTGVTGRTLFSAWIWAGATLLASSAALVRAQETDPALMHKVSGATDRLEMTVNSSRILTMEYNVPRVQVSNPDLLTVTPISAHDIQIHAKKAGITQVNLWDEKNKIHSIDVIILGDVKELANMLKINFPEASITIQPTAGSVILTGYVDKPESVNRIVRIAEDYFPKVINNITVGGAQQVMLYVKVMEVSRTKLRDLGFDFADVSGDIASGGLRSAVGGLLPGYTTNSSAVGGHNFPPGETLSFGIVDGNNSFFGILSALQRNNIVKLLAEPTLVTISGRPAYFQSGGEIPVLIPQGLGNVSVQYRPFGTQVDFVPIVLGEGKVRLEVRPRVSELDRSLSVTLNGSDIPGFRTRMADTGVEMRVGQTLALAGLIQSRIESSKVGVPWLGDLPYIGVPFRRVIDNYNEIELLILVRPELAEPLNPEEVPPCKPGTNTISPRDCDLYMRGYLEVPNPDCLGCQCTPAPAKMNAGTIPPHGMQDTPIGPLDSTGVSGEMGEDIPAPMPASDSLHPSARGRSAGPQRTATKPATAASRSGARPATGQKATSTGSVRQTPQNNPSSRNLPQAQPRTAARSGEPGLIGPSGYDVIK